MDSILTEDEDIINGARMKKNGSQKYRKDGKELWLVQSTENSVVEFTEGELAQIVCLQSEDRTSRSGRFDISINPVVTWDKKIRNYALEQFQHMIKQKYSVKLDTYWDLHRWSVQNYATFWEEVWHYCCIISSKPYDEVVVKTGSGFLDNDWFKGAEFNYAENFFKIRDDRIALICLDESGNEEIITYAELFEEVKLYAAAFRKNGLKKNDSVACYMSNRKEAIFAMLATASIGAIWGGPLPYYGGRAATNIINIMDPKFLFTIDFHQEERDPFPLLDYISLIANNTPTIQKVVLLVTDIETYAKDLSNIPNCVFLEKFLEDAYSPDGKVPDIVFEQLPANHPIRINFTSGTTGLPKGIIHSAITLISHLVDFALHLSLKPGDVVCSFTPVGWSLWDFFVPTLTLGVTMVLFCGSPYFIPNRMNFWDMLSKYNVKFTYLVTSMVDKMEKMNIVPGPGSNLDNLQVIAVGGSPVKKENFEFLQSKIKKDLFIGSMYGATESFGTFSGFCLNLPAYVGEIQAPSLGMDMQCYDKEGNSVVAQRGEVVICTPAPNFPIRLCKDEDNAKLKSTYLTKYPGVWSQNDECWISPNTNGAIVIGRSDDTFNQQGERFGAGDIYFAIHPLEELQDYICVGQSRYNGDCRAILFVKLKEGYNFTPALRKKIENQIEEELWDDCIPETIIEIPDIPYNLNNKRMESVVRKIVETNQIPDVINIKNPGSLNHFVDIPEIISYNQILM